MGYGREPQLATRDSMNSGASRSSGTDAATSALCYLWGRSINAIAACSSGNCAKEGSESRHGRTKEVNTLRAQPA